MRNLLARMSSRHIILPALAATGFLYILIYLLFSTPASYVHKHSNPAAFDSDTGEFLDAKTLLRKKSSKGREKETLLPKNGHGIWVEGRDIEIMSAIHDLHHQNTSETRIVLPSFLRHSSNRNFLCCFQASPASLDYVQIKANLDFIDLRFVVDLQNAAFECVLNTTAEKSKRLHKLVFFAAETCDQNISSPLKIIYPELRSFEFAVCTKVAYLRLEPHRLLEWFIFMQLIGASKVLTFHNNLDADSLRVFEYYVRTGFLELVEYRPRSKIGGPDVKFTETNGQTRQARQDKTLVVRDCQYRLGGYNFVMTIDFDELPVPIRPFASVNWIVQNLLMNHSDASAFRMDPILLPPEWSNPKPGLYHWQFTSGTHIEPYCRKWIYFPKRTWLAATHESIPKEGYKTYTMPESVLHFLHFRTCKPDWLDVGCDNLTLSIKNERVLDRFSGTMLQKLRKMPLEDLIPDKRYVEQIRKPPRNQAEARKTSDDSIESILN
ncbi:unnamed protein product [Lymnaea stagnalis]|uniref:Glycosyltransferase family 92 protein n=1 Tax=Lymnaea stagnalis TaxID=6523 RepID=A0AAV2H2C5_LYMST